MIVPGLGAVLAHGQLPYYSEEEGRWVAPRRVFSFNPALQRTDGLLAASVARRDEISTESATAIVKSEADQLIAQLHSEGHVALGAAGSLTLGEEGSMTFTSGDSAWLSPSCMWLPDVDIMPLANASALDREHRIRQTRLQLPGLLLRVGKAAACIAVVATLGWIAVQNLTYAPEKQYASVAPTQFGAEKPTVAVDESSPVVLVLAQAPKDETVENVAPAIVGNIPAPVIVEDAKYYLVVASLASAAEADEFLSQHSSTPLGILAKDGRYRIYAASGNSWDQLSAIAKSDDIAERYPNAWICRP